MRWYLLLVIIIAVGFVTPAIAGDDPSIKGEKRKQIQKAMLEHVQVTTIDGKYVIFDAVVGDLKKLKFKEVHKGIVKKGDFYVSCADFVDARGTLYDVDFLVSEKDDSYRVLQALVHAVSGIKRKYHLEEETGEKKKS
jgi:hypothetical protein